jgi:hypothetical protein
MGKIIIGSAVLTLTLALLSPLAKADSIAPAFAGAYTLTNLGTPTDVPGLLGGLTFLPGNPNELLVGGNANGSAGAIYEIGVTRDGSGHINGFSGPATCSRPPLTSMAG